MKHLGDITKINGAEIEAVDVITGGSPCQDLSVAGKRAGLAGARSGLFMEQIRIVKEMREHDRANGRTGDMVRPRFMVWENVPGAFSSNKGQDFAAVLEEIIRIAEPEAPDIEVPEKGWNTWGGYHDEVGGRWSVAWRVHDAQHWGVPQRRRRISVVADFGGDTAGGILFERKSVSGHLAESGAAGERAAETAEAGASYAVRIRGGCDGGGKGALVQTEKSGTIKAGNDQTIFCMATQQGGAELRTDDRAPTLTTAAGMSGNNQPVVCMTPWDCQSKRIFDTDGKSPTLQGGVGGGVNNPAIFTAIPINDKATRWQGGGESRDHDGSGNGLGIGKEGDPSTTLTAGDRHGVLCAGFKLGNSEKAHSIGYEEETSPTLNAECGGNKPAVVAFATNQREEVRDIGEKSVALAAEPGMHCQTFVAQKLPAVTLDMSHACDVIRDCGEVAPSLQARMGTGGNQIPLTYGIGNGQVNEAAVMAEEVSQTLNTMHDAQAVMCGVYCPEKAHALKAKANCDFREDSETYPVQNMVVRRLTPLECERLQGFPSGWTDIGEWRDSNGKLRKPSDSPRRKACGNSIALPFWDFLAKRISAQYIRPVTMGSLFDGIGGFPLVFERHNGKGTARWASEIEEFPIAVTKLRFGEE